MAIHIIKFPLFFIFKISFDYGQFKFYIMIVSFMFIIRKEEFYLEITIICLIYVIFNLSLDQIINLKKLVLHNYHDSNQ